MGTEKVKVLGEVKLEGVRLSFAQLFRPKAVEEGGEPRFSASFLFDRKKPEGEAIFRKVAAAFQEVKAQKWGADHTKQPKLSPDRICMRDGDLKDYDGYEGMWYVTAGSPKERRPRVIDRAKRPLTEEDGVLYSGCYVNAVVRLWAQDDKKFGKRVNASLEAVQFVRDGDAFGAKPVDVDALFDDLSDGADSGDDFGGAQPDDDDLLS